MHLERLALVNSLAPSTCNFNTCRIRAAIVVSPARS